MSENEAYDEFIRGVVSGINFASAESGRHPVVRPSPVELIAWVRTWCSSHPDMTMINTVLSYLQEQYTGSPIGVPSPAAPIPAIAAGQAAMQKAAPQFVFVIFQKDVVAADMASFLKSFRVAIDDGPNPDGYYKLRLAEPLPPDQLNAILDAMRGQGKIVGTAVAN